LGVARRVTLASGLTLSCEVRGDGGSTPPVVLLAGPTDSWRSYQPVLDALPSPGRAVAVSPRGHGDSDKPASGHPLPAELVDELVAEVLKVSARVWQEMFAALLRYDDLEALPHIQAPTLLLWGDGDALVPRQAQEELLRRLPDATLVVHPGAGHTPRWEDPSRVAAELVGLVGRLPATG
jgi:pimeloyl-ACP methyl ester carboxylesterase